MLADYSQGSVPGTGGGSRFGDQPAKDELEIGLLDDARRCFDQA
jgi:hypothetical protein